MTRIENSFLAQFLLLVWDGFRIIGTEFLRMSVLRAARFADVAWLVTISLTLAYVALMLWLGATL